VAAAEIPPGRRVQRPQRDPNAKLWTPPAAPPPPWSPAGWEHTGEITGGRAATETANLGRAYRDDTQNEQIITRRAVRLTRLNGNGVPVALEVYGDPTLDRAAVERAAARFVLLTERYRGANPPRSGAPTMRILPMADRIGGYAVLGSRVTHLNARLLTVDDLGPVAPHATRSTLPGIVQGRSLAESVVGHEWAHASDLSPFREVPAAVARRAAAAGVVVPAGATGNGFREALFDHVTRAGLAWPSLYARQNSSELVAEAFAEWTVFEGNVDRCSPATRLVVEIYGWVWAG
jgi:hypothetical protein